MPSCRLYGICVQRDLIAGYPVRCGELSHGCDYFAFLADADQSQLNPVVGAYGGRFKQVGLVAPTGLLVASGAFLPAGSIAVDISRNRSSGATGHYREFLRK